MKRLLLILLLLTIALTGCGNTTEYRDGYEIAVYEKFNSYVEDNGLDSTKITIQGTVKSVFDFGEISEFSVVTEEGDRWLVSLIQVNYSEEIDELLDEEYVTVYGVYMGYSDIFLMPAMYAERIVVDGKDYYLEDLPSYQAPTETPTEKHTEAPTAAPTESPTEAPQIILYDANGIKVTYKNITYDGRSTNVNLLIENNSDRDYCIQTRDMSVNGFMLEPIFSSDVTSGNKANDAFTFHNSRLKENDISEINHIEFKFHIFDWNDRDSVIETDTISFDT